MISGAQVRVARALLRWTARDLARRAVVSVSTVNLIEGADGLPSTTRGQLEAVQATFEAEGIESWAATRPSCGCGRRSGTQKTNGRNCSLGDGVTEKNAPAEATRAGAYTWALAAGGEAEKAPSVCNSEPVPTPRLYRIAHCVKKVGEGSVERQAAQSLASRTPCDTRATICSKLLTFAF